jgi:hypothetical protein
LQSAASPNKRAGNSKRGGQQPAPAKRGLLPITIVIAVLIALASIGGMVGVLLGFWPPRTSSEAAPAVGPTPKAILEAGLKLEAVGTPARDPKDPSQVILGVRVTNQVQMALPFKGTPTQGVPAPTKGPVTICSALFTVIYYNDKGGEAGRGFGGVGIVPYQQQSEVVTTYGKPVGEFQRFELVPDSLSADTECKPAGSYPYPTGRQVSSLPLTP